MSSSVDELYNALMDAGLSEIEIEQQIVKKTEDFQGFITKRGILFLIAKEMGLSIQSFDIEPELYEEFEEELDYDEFTIKVSELKENMSNIVLLGRISRNFGIKQFNRKDGTPGIVGSFLIYDETGNIKVVLWNNHVKIMESEYFKKAEIIRLIGAYSKRGINNKLEIHLSKNGKIILAPKDVNPNDIPVVDKDVIRDMPDIITTTNEIIKNLYHLDRFVQKIKGTIIDIEEFKEIDKKNGEKSFLLKLIINDNTSSIRLVLWDMKAIECLKIINIGDLILLSNVLIKTNSYTGEKELIFNHNSRLEKI